MIRIIPFLFIALFLQAADLTQEERWQLQYEITMDTPEASMVVRVGDIDNMGQGWPQMTAGKDKGKTYDPLSGRTTPERVIPFTSKHDAPGTDQLFLISSYAQDNPLESDDTYVKLTANMGASQPKPLNFEYVVPDEMVVESAAIELFLYDLQAPKRKAEISAKINGKNAPFIANSLNRIIQPEGTGRLFSFPLPARFLHEVRSGSLTIEIDDPHSGQAEAFAIDFGRLLINLKYKEDNHQLVYGYILDSETEEPIAGAEVAVAGQLTVQSDEAGFFEIRNLPVGEQVLVGTHPDYRRVYKSIVLAYNEYQGATLLLNPINKFTLGVLDVKNREKTTMEILASEMLQYDPEIVKRALALKEIEQDIRISLGSYLPTLNLDAAYTGEQDSESYGTDDVILTPSYGARAAQMLFDGFDTHFTTKAQKARLISASFYLDELHEQKLLEYTEAYINLFRALDLLELSRASVDSHQDNFNVIQTKAESGFANTSELKQSESRLELAKANLVIERNNFEERISALQKYTLLEIDDMLFKTPAFGCELPHSLVEAMEQTSHVHPSIKVAEYNIQVKDYEKKQQRSQFLPYVEAVGEVEWAEPDNSAAGTDTQSYKIGIQATWNLFNGGKDTHTVEKQQIIILQEEEELNKIRRDARERLELAWASYKYLENQIEHLNRHVDLSRETMESYEEEFKLGRRNLLDLLDAEKEYNTARETLLNAQYDLLLSQYRVREATGTLKNCHLSTLEKQKTDASLVRGGDFLDIRNANTLSDMSNLSKPEETFADATGSLELSLDLPEDSGTGDELMLDLPVDEAVDAMPLESDTAITLESSDIAPIIPEAPAPLMIDLDTTDVETATPTQDFLTINKNSNQQMLTIGNAGELVGGLSEFAFEIEFRTRSRESDFIPLLSYATPNDERGNTLLIGGYDDKNLCLYLDNQIAFSEIPMDYLTDGEKHYLRVTWNSTGEVDFFLDGKQHGHTTGFMTGYKIPNGGIAIIGQEQDSYGAGFQDSQFLNADIYTIKLFDTSKFTQDAPPVASWQLTSEHVQGFQELGGSDYPLRLETTR